MPAFAEILFIQGLHNISNRKSCWISGERRGGCRRLGWVEDWGLRGGFWRGDMPLEWGLTGRVWRGGYALSRKKRIVWVK